MLLWKYVVHDDFGINKHGIFTTTRLVEKMTTTFSLKENLNPYFSDHIIQRALSKDY